MERATKATAPASKRPTPAPGRRATPRSLSERPDTQPTAVTGPLASPGIPGVPSQPELVDSALIKQSALWIRDKLASTLRKGAEEVGEYVLEAFFRGDVALARAHTPNKNVSYRALVELCGTPELPISRTWLNNAVGIALLVRRLPNNGRAFRALPPSYQETV